MADEHEDEYNSEDAKQVDKRKTEEKNAINLEADDLKFLMTQPQFRRFMWHLIERCQIRDVLPGTATEREVGILDGIRSIGNRYFGNVIDQCPDRYNEMVKQMQKKGNAYND